jgi:MFS family permease
MVESRLFSRPFLILWTFYFFVFVAGYQLFPLVPFRLRELGAGLAESGWFMAAFTLGSGLGGLVTGPLADRLGQRRVLRGASLFSALFFVAYAFLPVRWGFLVLAPLHGFVWSGLRTASVARVGELLPEGHRAEGMSFFGLASPGGVAVGPLLGLWLQPHLGFKWLVLLLGLVFLVLHLLIKELSKDPPKHLRNREPWHLPERSVWLPALILFLLALSYGPMAPYSAQEARALDMGWTSAYLTCFALGMMGLRFLLGITGLGPRPARLIPGLLAVSLAGCLLLALLPGGLVRHITGGLVYGAGYGMVHTLLFLVVMDAAEPKRRGAGVGALYGAYDAGVAAGALLLGPLMQAYGFRAGWAGGAVAVGLAMLLALRVRRQWSAVRP